jgi:hypothetical protein
MSQKKNDTAITNVAFHIDLCFRCEKKHKCKSGALFGVKPPEDCPYLIEHIVGDKDNE